MAAYYMKYSKLNEYLTTFFKLKLWKKYRCQASQNLYFIFFHKTTLPLHLSNKKCTLFRQKIKYILK